jgi:DNA replication ATP-dependent helicase Dna2
MDHTDESLYVLAYTNKAVDELCSAIESLGENYVNMYVRVGSAYGANEKYVPNLLRSKIKGITRRNKLRDKIKSHRSVVGTIASLASRQIIYELIPPKRLIVDEASQILEPNIVGLLTLFEQFVLVGDHKQLPAVVVQRQDESAIDNEMLNEIGLSNRRNSLFERLYSRAVAKGKSQLYGQLQLQARMHKTIMKFPNEQFYHNELKVLPDLSRLVEDVEGEMPRLGFIQADVPDVETFSKTNHSEIAALIKLIPRFLDLGFKAKEIGVITPFRAQIAAIQKAIQLELSEADGISIDTVERYQGSAKKVIIISFCCNSILQFEQMQSLDENKVDRKLNVALTRAKEHLILVGDERILGANTLYKELIDSCEKLDS